MSGIEVDPIKLRKGVQVNLGTALHYLTPQALEALGPESLALMVDTAGRYNLTLGQLVREMLFDSSHRTATLARQVYARTAPPNPRKPRLTLVK